MTTATAGSSLYTEIDADNIAWLHFDTQGSSTNVLSASLLEDFYKQLLDLETRSPRGLVIVSDKPNGFIAGADVHEFIRIENRAQALSLSCPSTGSWYLRTASSDAISNHAAPSVICALLPAVTLPNGRSNAGFSPASFSMLLSSRKPSSAAWKRPS